MLNNLDDATRLALQAEKLGSEIAHYSYRLNAAKAELKATEAELKKVKSKDK